MINLNNIKGLGESTSKILVDHGIKSAEDLAGISVDELCQVPGFGGIRAERVINEAKLLVGSSGQATKEKTAKAPEGKKKEKKKDKKKDKKRRKKEKKKSKKNKKGKKK